MTECEPYRHEHPSTTIALETRTRLLGTLNLAVALRGRSCGWGTCERPRRTFVGHNRVNPGGGLHFARLVIDTGYHRRRVLFQIGDRLGGAA